MDWLPVAVLRALAVTGLCRRKQVIATDPSGAIFVASGLWRSNEKNIIGCGCPAGDARQTRPPVARIRASMGNDDRTSNARSSGGLDVDGEGRAEDGADQAG